MEEAEIQMGGGEETGGRPRRRLGRIVLLLVLLAIVLGLSIATRWLPAVLVEREHHAQARGAIQQFLDATDEDAEIMLLEEAIAPLEGIGVTVLADEVWETGNLRMMQVFDGLDPRLTMPQMRRLTAHSDPDIRHCALLSMGRVKRVDEGEWRRIVEDASEDPFIRQLAAHQLKEEGRWWEGLTPSQPMGVDGLPERRVTYLKQTSTFGAFCDEFAWVLGSEADYPPGLADEPLDQVYYFAVGFGGLLRDMHLRETYHLHEFVLDGTTVRVRRIYKDE